MLQQMFPSPFLFSFLYDFFKFVCILQLSATAVYYFSVLWHSFSLIQSLRDFLFSVQSCASASYAYSYVFVVIEFRYIRSVQYMLISNNLSLLCNIRTNTTCCLKVVFTCTCSSYDFCCSLKPINYVLSGMVITHQVLSIHCKEVGITDALCLSNK